MCGIAGLILDRPGTVDGSLLREVQRGLAHRGPDGDGWLAFGHGGVSRGEEIPVKVSGEVVLLSRRLAVLDLSRAGDQPMATPGGRYALVFNGEIYNYLELRKALEAAGETFRTKTDTEVLLAALARYGPAALERLVGMYAFALLDMEERTLLLGRDPLGQKPLYHVRWRGGLAFCSEIPPLLELPGVTRLANPERLYGYLRFGLSDAGEATFFADVRQLPAGCLASIPLRGRRAVRPQRHWRPSAGPCVQLGFDEAAAELRERFLESVSLHLRSDAALGFALSGGVDSSSIVMAARHLRGERYVLDTFSYRAGHPDLDESRWIDLVAHAARAKVHDVRFAHHEPLADLDLLMRAQGEPVEEPPAYAEHRVFGRAREAGMTVVLNGQGADELLGGYPWSLTARLASLARRRRLVAATGFAARAARHPRAPGLRPLVFGDALVLPGRWRDRVRWRDGGGPWPAWLRAEWFRRAGVEPALPRTPEGCECLRERLILDLVERKLPRLLRHADRNSMSHSIECRLPFLTPSLVDFLLALPEEHLVARDGTSKAVFRAAMRGLVPSEILDRRDKIGFTPPVRSWLLVTRALALRMLTSEAARRVSGIAGDVLAAELAAPAVPSAELTHRVWRALNVVRWARVFAVDLE
jgi:asparagine synthase (glutamine-hydrolysing)